MTVFALRYGFYRELLGIYSSWQLAHEASLAQGYNPAGYDIEEVALDAPATSKE